MKAKLTLIIFLISIFLFSGCAPTAVTPNFFAGGDKGITMSFLENSPPKTAFDTDTFNIVVQAENVGEYNIPKGELHFTLANAPIFGLQQIAHKTNTQELAGKKIAGNATINGGVEFITYEKAGYHGVKVITEQEQISFSVQACYPYQSNATALVCISQTGKKCKTNEEKTVYSSGAPVKITSAKEIAFIPHAENKNIADMAIGFTIENKGGGDVYSSITDCQNKLSTQTDEVLISSISLGSRQLTSSEIESSCGERNIILDENGQAKVTCQIKNIPAEAEYEDWLVIVLNYKYVQKIDSTISFIHIG